MLFHCLTRMTMNDISDAIGKSEFSDNQYCRRVSPVRMPLGAMNHSPKRRSNAS